jgi:hypothetical protein
MDVSTSQRVGRVMVDIRCENPEMVKPIIALIESGVVFEDFPENVKNIVREKESNNAYHES